MPTPSDIKFKRGSSFAMTITYSPPEGGLPNLLGADIESQVLDIAGIRHDLSASLDGTGLIITLEADAESTVKWAVGLAYMDVKVSVGGSVIYTDTLPFPIIPQVTID